MNFLINTPYFSAEPQVTKLLKDAGAKGDKKEIETMISKLKGKDIPKLIAEGYGKFAAIGGGGGSAAAAPAGGSAAPAEAGKDKKEEKEEAKAEESAGSIGGFFGEEEDDY